MFQKKSILLKIAILLFLCFYSFFNINNFLSHNGDGGLEQERRNVKEAIAKQRVIEFKEGSPESYLYYIYTLKNQK